MKKQLLAGAASLVMAARPMLGVFATEISVTGDASKDVTVGEVDETVTWVSGNPTVATVDQEGVVTAHSAGNAFITAKSNEDEKFTFEEFSYFLNKNGKKYNIYESIRQKE